MSEIIESCDVMPSQIPLLLLTLVLNIETLLVLHARTLPTWATTMPAKVIVVPFRYTGSIGSRDMPRCQPPADQALKQPYMASAAIINPIYSERRNTFLLNRRSLTLLGGSCIMPASTGSRLKARDGMASMPKSIART